jgi:hypothetical protein
MSSLAVDIVEDVLVNILSKSYTMDPLIRDPFDWDVSTLLSAALVNTSWRHASQKILFKSIRARGAFRRSYLARDISPSDQILLTHVHNLDVCTLRDESSSVALIFQRFPNLKTIWFDWTNLNKMSPLQIESLRETLSASSSHLRLTELYICPAVAYDNQHIVPRAQLYQILSTFSTLTTLRLGEGLTVGCLPPACQTLAFTSSLQHLELDDPVSQTHLEWVLTHSLSTITSIHFRSLFVLDKHTWIADPFVATSTCWSIRTLRFDRGFNELSSAVVEACPHLERLAIELTENDRPVPFYEIFHTIRHLTVIHRNLPDSTAPAMHRAFEFRLYWLVDESRPCRLWSLVLGGAWREHMFWSELLKLEEACKIFETHLEFRDACPGRWEVRLLLGVPQFQVLTHCY